MPWTSVENFRASETYKNATAMHGWAHEKLAKFVSAFRSVYERAVRNGADKAKAEALAFPVAFSLARRAASAETVGKAESTIHYFAGFVPQMNSRNENGEEVSASEFKFTLVEKSLPLMRGLVAGLAFNFDHEHGSEVGLVRDIILRSAAPPEVQKAMDPDVPFLFVASYRSDVSAEAREEIKISPEWLVMDGNEVFPMTFAATHTPLNDDTSGIKRVAATLLAEPVEAVVAAPAAQVSPEPRPYLPSGGLPVRDHSMPDPPATPADNSALEARYASLSATLDTEKKARQDAELKFAATKEEVVTLRKVVDEMRAAASDKEAEDAALKMVRDGQIASDAVAKFASLYKKLGKVEFESLSASLPATHLGEVQAKSASVAELDTQSPVIVEMRKAAKAGLAKGAF